ncbi:MAG: hypothetical protein F4103_19115 [Boseongicola sp. SB0673_bin_14]|nr:hypothetical protein [Boseongicola sp. SB0673_bin_14]
MGPVFMRRFRHPFDGQEVKVIERRRGGGSHHKLNLHVELPDGVRMWLPATWTSLDARDPDAPKLLGELPDFIRLRNLLDDLERRLEATDGQGTGTVAAGASGVGATRGEVASDSSPGPGGVGAGVGGADGPAGGPEGDVR